MAGNGLRTEPTVPFDSEFLATRDPAIDWETSQKYGLFSMAAELIRDNVAHLQAGAQTNVIVLDNHRRTQ